MESHALEKDTVLDGRYNIQKILGEGGFGITYEAENEMIRLKVAVKELFWRGHVKRDTENHRDVMLISDEDKADYSSIKERFMREARLLRDFDSEPGVVKVLDYFEENNTAYLVMEYLDGVTLRRYIKDHGVFAPENIFRRMLSVMESLGNIHRAGVIHRDISPDNIMVMEDGSLRLMDFGAARNFKAASGIRYTAIARENYAPPEQFDKSGRQGPWTDIYALCATIYEAVAGSAPESAVQRMFLDELKKPSQMGINIEPAYEKIIMRGLGMKPESRYADMEEMKNAVEAALPLIVQHDHKKRGIKIAVAAAACLAGLFIGISAYREYDRLHKFRNVETETFRLTAAEDMTAEEMEDARILLEERIAEFAGEDNYILKTDNDSVTVTLPLSEFEEHEIDLVIEENFVYINAEKPFEYEYEIKASWENPEGSLIAGENQCMPEEVSGVTVTQVYAGTNDAAVSQMTRGEKSNLLTDLKVRLDSLDTPYAIGLLYGNDSRIVVKIAADRMGELISGTVGRNALAYIRGKWHCDSVAVMRNPYAESGTNVLSVGGNKITGYKLACDIAVEKDAERLRDSSEYSIQIGEEELYLDLDFGDYIAGAPLYGSILDGTIEFTDVFLEDDGVDNEKQKIFLQYVCALINDTNMPEPLYLYEQMFQNESGDILYEAEQDDYYGLDIKKSPDKMRFDLLIGQIERDGWDVRRTDGNTAWISFGLDAGEDLIKDGFETAAEFIEYYGLSGCPDQFYLCFTDEKEDERCRIILADSVTERKISAALVMRGESMEPYFKEAIDAWDEISLGENIIKEEPDLSVELS